MIHLPNGCSASIPTVTPKNWRELKKISGPWKITYRFRDPVHGTRQIKIMGMNRDSNLQDRKDSTKDLLQEIQRLLKCGYNPFLKKRVVPTEAPAVITASTPFTDALSYALQKITVAPKTRKEIAKILPNIQAAARKLSLDLIEIQEMRKSHIKAILEQVRTFMPKFSDKTFNHYRAYLQILFNELDDVIEANPATAVKKKIVATAPRSVLTDDQRTLVDGLLQEKYPAFHRFLHIFFHSGARISELMRLQVKDVDLLRQRYRCEIKKGKSKRTVERTIKNIALPLWQHLLEGAAGEDFVFSKGLVPGPRQISSDQVNKRWYRLVKKGKDPEGNPLGISADFYSMKHLHTSDVVDQLDDQAAASMNQHTTTAMVVRIYDTKRQDREHERLKNLNTPFVK